MWDRTEIWNQLEQPWDIIVIGGGITGAGIFREATRLGLKTLLLEARDFAWGTSSRSSKMVHGGLRYMKEGQFGLTLASVRERSQLLHDAPGLVEPLPFLLVSYKGDTSLRWLNRLGVTVYDLMARQWNHHAYGRRDVGWLAPRLQQQRLAGAMGYGDAQTDDARLVLRVILEGVAEGGVALNYAAVEELMQGENGVEGVHVHDQVADRRRQVRSHVVVNATGAWADRFRAKVGQKPRLRPLRGSHLIFPAWRLPVAQAVSFAHPLDGRWVFVFPWEGVTIVGTTDVDHPQDVDEEPRISPMEVAYLMAAVTSHYPSLNLTLDDVLATFAGVRPVVGTGKQDPSDESREHVVWQEEGLLTVTGGKLTTFRVIAHDALEVACDRISEQLSPPGESPVLEPVNLPQPQGAALEPEQWRRLLGYYGRQAPDLLAVAEPGELEPIPGTPYVWAEVRWAARSEAVVHLDDLMLRRLRLGLLLPQGGVAHLPRIRTICQAELGWKDSRWELEASGYQARWQKSYALPARDAIPDWRALLERARREREERRTRRRVWTGVSTALLAGAVASVALMYRYLADRHELPEAG